MDVLLWLLLPVAAASGWVTARRTQAATPPQKKLPHQFSQQCIQGLNYLLSEQSDKAIQLFVELVDVDEDTVETHLVLGSLFRRRGEVDKAIRVHQNVVARSNLSAEQKNSAFLQLGIDYLKAGVLDRAENIFLQLIDDKYESPEVFRYLRMLYEKEREWADAISMAERLEKAGGQSQKVRIAHYHCEMVEKHVREQRDDEARESIQKAINTAPNCVRAFIQSGDLLTSLGQRKEAMQSYRAALEKEGYFSPLVMKHLYDLFAADGDLQHFPDFVHKHVDYQHDASVRFFLIKTYEGLGDEVKVRQMLHDELKRDEASPYIVRAYLEMMRDNTQGEIRESFEVLERLLEMRLSTHMACHCTQCGFESNVIFWQCPSCQNWGTGRPYQNPVEYTWVEKNE
jgi:lipopolysaccharide biosynthesis regulator YciM